MLVLKIKNDLFSPNFYRFWRFLKDFQHNVTFPRHNVPVGLELFIMKRATIYEAFCHEIIHK